MKIRGASFMHPTQNVCTCYRNRTYLVKKDLNWIYGEHCLDLSVRRGEGNQIGIQHTNQQRIEDKKWAHSHTQIKPIFHVLNAGYPVFCKVSFSFMVLQRILQFFFVINTKNTTISFSLLNLTFSTPIANLIYW